jgi:uncharacterized Zn-binding protein involved in type VI secretion
VCPRAEEEEIVVSQAAKEFDVVIGIDIHMVTIPTPPGTAPLPHPFVGIVYDPIGGFIGAVLAKFTGGGPVYINGLHAAGTGTAVDGQHHVPTPPGISFAPNDVPGNDGSIVSGSKTVHFSGASAARRG